LEHETEPSSSFQKSHEPRGLLYILFSAFGVLWLWSKLRTPNQDSRNSQHPQDSTNNATQIGQNISSPVHVVIDASPPTPTPNKEREAREERQEGRDKKRLQAEIILAFVTSILLIANLFLVFTARYANKIARDALYVNHRPWVGNDGGIQFPEPLRFELFPTTRNIHLRVRYSIKNYGTAPGIQTSSIALLFVQKGILVRPEGTMKLACMNADSISDAVIFPGQSIQIDNDSRTNFEPTMHTIGQIWIVICTCYKDDTGKIHHTKTWALTKPPDGAQPVIAVPGDPLLYYPFSQAAIDHEETDEQPQAHQ
jgi:hypothetical protein